MSHVSIATRGVTKGLFSCACHARDDRDADRRRLMQYLALLEHPDALPRDLALRLAGELLALTESASPGFRCEPV